MYYFQIIIICKFFSRRLYVNRLNAIKNNKKIMTILICTEKLFIVYLQQHANLVAYAERRILKNRYKMEM